MTHAFITLVGYDMGVLKIGIEPSKDLIDPLQGIDTMNQRLG